MRPEDSALAPYLRAIRAHWIIFTLVFLATLAGGIAYMAAKAPDYRTDAELLVNPLPDDRLTSLPIVHDTGDPTRTIQTAAELVDSHAIAALTAQELGDGWTRGKVSDAIEVSPQGQTNIIEITATWTDPDTAADLANGYANAVVESRKGLLKPLAEAELNDIKQERAEIQGDTTGVATGQLESARLDLLRVARDGTDPTLALSQEAVPPSDPEGIPTFILLALAILAGLVLATGTVLLIEILTPDRIGSEEELLRVFPLPILARVPKLSRDRRRPAAGTLELDPLVRESFRTLQLQLELKGTRRRAIMIASASRGDGKTSAAANFALELADSGAMVIAIDADLRKPDLGRALGVSSDAPVDGSAPKLEGEADGDPLKPVPGRENMWLLDLQDIRALEGADRYGKRMKGLVTGMLNAVDYVVVDTPPLGEVSDALTILDEVDDVIIVTRPGNTRRLSLEIARDLLDRSGVEPTGYVVVGGQSTSGRYPYGNA